MVKRRRTSMVSRKSSILKRARAAVTKTLRTGGFAMNRRGQIMGSSGRIESKFLDQSFNVSALWPIITVTAIVQAINPIAQGVDAITRVGRKITMKYVTWRMFMTPAIGTTGVAQNFRMVLVYDKQFNGAAAPAAGSVVFNNDRITGLPNLDNRDRFLILKEWKWALAPIVVTATSNFSTPTTVYKKGFYRFKRGEQEVVYNNLNNALVTGINTGALFYYCFSDGNFATAPPTGFFDHRLRFQDA